MPLAAANVCLRWKMLRMIEEKTGQSAIVSRGSILLRLFSVLRRKPAGPRKRRVALRYIIFVAVFGDGGWWPNRFQATRPDLRRDFQIS
jgi:hypothetical protein